MCPFRRSTYYRVRQFGLLPPGDRLNAGPLGFVCRQFTVKVTRPSELPWGVTTVTGLGERVAVDVIEQVAATLVPAALAVAPVQVTPPPVIVTAVAPVRLTPVTVTGTFVEPDAGRAAEVGVIDEILTKFVVSVAVLLAVLESVTPAGGVTVTTFDIELVPASTIAAGASADRLPRNVYVALPPAGSVIVPVRVELPIPVAVHEPPVVVEQVQLLTDSSVTGPIAGNVSDSVAFGTVCVPLLVTTTV